MEDISQNDAGAQNLTLTTCAVNNIIDSCKKDKRKAICFVTGIPGAGKTLVGLNIANERYKFENDEYAVFLSGNGPLVDVLQMALVKDRASREGITIAMAKRETKAFIQFIHKFRDEALDTSALLLKRSLYLTERRELGMKTRLQISRKEKRY